MNAIEIKDIFNYRYLSSLKYSPDGKCAAFVVSGCSKEENSYESRLWLYDGSRVRQLTELGSERSFIWENDSAILFPAVRSAAEKKRREKKELFTSYYRLDLSGGEALHAFTLPVSVQSIEKTDWGFAVLADIDKDYPDYYKMNDKQRADTAEHYEAEKDYEVFGELPFYMNGAGVTNGRRTALFTLINGTLTRITAPDFDISGIACTGDFIYFSGVSYESVRPLKDGRIYRLDVRTGEVSTVVNRPELSIDGLEYAEDRLYVLASDCSRYGINENAWVWVYQPETGEFSVLRREEYSMYGSVGSDCRYGSARSMQPVGNALYHLTTRGCSAHLYRLSPDGESVPVITKEGSIDDFAVSSDGSKALLIALYDNRLQELYCADLKSGSMEKISSFNDEALRDKYVAEPRGMKIQSCGYDIEGWVLLPKDYDPSKKYPAVLDIHGGPKTVYGPVFYHEMQVWAGMGYFVFFCNPKGGDGGDNRFMDIRGDYGGTDYENLMDFTDAVLAAYPQIDPARVCVTGGSYGGFMTNWIIGHTDRFCCAASQRSISNWLSFHGVSDIGFYFAGDQCGADFFENPEKLWQHSPVRYAQNVKTPTLFIHSDEDYRCPLEQGLQMYTAISVRGVPARLCLFHGENHELSRSGKPLHRVRRLTEITSWFGKYSK